MRLSSQSKSMPVLCVAACSATGMWTRPKVIAPFHSTRVLELEVAITYSYLPSFFIAPLKVCFVFA